MDFSDFVIPPYPTTLCAVQCSATIFVLDTFSFFRGTDLFSPEWPPSVWPCWSGAGRPATVNNGMPRRTDLERNHRAQVRLSSCITLHWPRAHYYICGLLASGIKVAAYDFRPKSHNFYPRASPLTTATQPKSPRLRRGRSTFL